MIQEHRAHAGCAAMTPAGASPLALPGRSRPGRGRGPTARWPGPSQGRPPASAAAGGPTPAPGPAGPARPLPAAGVLLGLLLVLLVLLLPAWVAPARAAELKVSAVSLEPCPVEDAGRQPELRRPAGASCYALRGEVSNPGRRPVVDTDVFALILDSSGEPVLPNRSRVGSIGDVPPGISRFALRLAIPAGTPGPFQVRNPRARGFSAPVRSRAAADEELLPLEQELAPS